MKKNDEFELEITDCSDEGAGIGKADGFTWFVKDAVIGDRVLVGVTKLKKNYGFARVLRVLRPSKDRVEPACPIARQCGGCQLQALSYAAQLQFKQNKVLGCLRRIGGFSLEEMEAAGTLEIAPIIGMESPYRSRNKAQFPVGEDRNGKLVAGFYAGRTHSIIPCRDCLLGCEENQPVLDCVLSWMEAFGVSAYQETAGSGIVRHILIRKAHYTAEMMVCLVVNARKLPHAAELVERLLALPAVKITSISYCINQERTNVIMGTELRELYGPGYITDEIHRPGSTEGLSFQISPLSFYQVNPVQMEKLYATALSFAQLDGSETVWDLYCGIGTISLFLAKSARKVYGVEIIPQAIENARENAVRNGISNAEFFVGKAEEVLPAWYENQCKEQRDGSAGAEEKNEQGASCASAHGVDVIVVDPPRKGCDKACLETMLKIRPKRIVYVSCDCSTLARDLKILCDGGYALRKVQVVDQFAFSVHVEVVIQMTYCGDKRK